MGRVATYVFFDLETTGLPYQELNKTRITELSMVAVSRCHVLDTKPQEAPRVKHKLTLCFNPARVISPVSTKITGLCNFLLERATLFNSDVFKAIDGFLALLEKPVCLVAHNGNKFDFPILKNHFEKLQCALSDDIMCADSLNGFRDILQPVEVGNVDVVTKFSSEGNHLKRSHNELEDVPNNGINDTDVTDILNINNEQLQQQLSMKSKNETTPKGPKIMKTSSNASSEVKKRLPFNHEPKKLTYNLECIYERVLQCPPINSHQAESDCIMMLKIAVALKKQFVDWVDMNCYPFNNVKPMSLAKRLGE